jgi:spermidine synthase
MNMSFALALVLAAVSGFIALAYEIVWARVFSFTTGSRAEAFGAMLGGYLLGLAVGSILSRRWQTERFQAGRFGLLILSRLIVAANVAAFLVVPLVSWLLAGAVPWAASRPLVMAGAALMGTILPLVCHMAIPPDGKAGARISYLYLANIVGSSFGSLFTGFVLMDGLTLWQIESLLLIFAILISVALARSSAAAVAGKDHALWMLAALMACGSPLIHQGLYERLQYKGEYHGKAPFAQVVESRHGVITVDSYRTVYGGGVYDGRIDIRPRHGGGLVRPFFLSALHACPREILVIGMSAGAWTQILAHHPAVERVTVVEISKGYLEVIQSHPQVSSLLTNPKVQIVIDDGRRWLRRNPERRFDAVVMNTSHHYREFASAVLSKEFLELVKSRLNPGGIVLWNCTQSARAARTGMAVFSDTIMVGNSCVGSQTPLNIDRKRWQAVLAAYRIDGRLVFDQNTPQGRCDLAWLLSVVDAPGDPSRIWGIMDRAEMERAYGTAAIITDDNLGQEYEDRVAGHPVLNRLLFFLML